MTAPAATSITEDIETMTAGYLAALKANSDEIARLAEALRAAESEGVRYLNERDEARNMLADRVIAHRHVEAERNAARADAATLAAALKPLGKSGLGNPPIWVCDARAALAAHEGASTPSVDWEVKAYQEYRQRMLSAEFPTEPMEYNKWRAERARALAATAPKAVTE